MQLKHCRTGLSWEEKRGEGLWGKAKKLRRITGKKVFSREKPTLGKLGITTTREETWIKLKLQKKLMGQERLNYQRNFGVWGFSLSGKSNFWRGKKILS